MSWHVQYMIPSGETVEFFATPEKAIEAACMLIDSGLEVFGIGTGPLSDSISKTEIAKIYNLWLPEAKPAL